MLRDVTGRICFDQEIEVAPIFVRGDGGVGANYFFGLAFNGRSDGNVLANWKTQYICGSWETESITNAGQIWLPLI